jgi:uncharacterized membrane protein YcaP (DUF421 family)
MVAADHQKENLVGERIRPLREGWQSRCNGKADAGERRWRLTILDVLKQIGLACLYYIGLTLIVRLAGKRLAGQTTTIDLIILISLGVVLQNLALVEGQWNSAVFLATVFTLHVSLARICRRFPAIRRLLREQPRPLIRHGRILPKALEDEGLTEEELLAALRRMGVDSPKQVRLAMLEETGHISAIRNDGTA